MAIPFRPETLTPERSVAWRLAAKRLRGGATGRVGALRALAEAGYAAADAERIVSTMIAQGTA